MVILPVCSNHSSDESIPQQQVFHGYSLGCCVLMFLGAVHGPSICVNESMFDRRGHN